MTRLERFSWGAATLLVGGCAEAPAVEPAIRGRPDLAGADSPLAPRAVAPPRPGFPLLARPAPGSPACDLAAWAHAARRLLDERLEEAGAVLLRGLPICSPADFSVFRSVLGYTPVRYTGLAARTEVAPGVLTTNSLTSQRTIMLHNELPYEFVVPRHLFFYCEVPPGPGEGGETPIARNADWHVELGEPLIAHFERRGLVRRLDHSATPDPAVPHRSWQGRFLTQDPSEVERICRERGIAFEWQADGSLTLWHEQVTTIELSGKRLWFCAPQSAPADSIRYRDGSPLEPEIMDRLRASQWKIAVGFAWRASDVLCLDNVTCQHGRLSYAPHVIRKLFLSLGTPFPIRPWVSHPAAGG